MFKSKTIDYEESKLSNFSLIINGIAKIPTLNQMRHKKAEDKKYAL